MVLWILGGFLEHWCLSAAVWVSCCSEVSLEDLGFRVWRLRVVHMTSAGFDGKLRGRFVVRLLLGVYYRGLNNYLYYLRGSLLYL